MGNTGVPPRDEGVREPNPSAQPAEEPSEPEPGGARIAHERAAPKVTPRLERPDVPVAKTHAEVLALQRQSSRSYVEFSVKRSKRFQSVGPVSVQLRNADSKHGYYDVALIVDGHQLKKKHVNLYEPIWITTNQYSPPLELVVNGIGKNQISGYLSEPKSRRVSGAQTARSNARTGGR